MRFHIMVKNHMGDTSTTALCEPCARKSGFYPLREPGDGSRCPDTGRLLAGPVVTRESAYGSCANCGEGDTRPGYLRTCAACSRWYLLDHCEEAWPPPAWFCPRPACRKARD